MVVQLFKDLFTMIEDINTSSPALGVWGKALNFPMFIGGLMFITTFAGAGVLISNLIAVLIAAQIHKRQHLSRLTSICHVVWLPVLPFLVMAVLETTSTTFLIWGAYTLATMTISLVLDVANLYRYFFTNSPDELVPAG